MEGYKTWIGLIVTVMGMLGLGYLVSADQIAQFIDLILKVVGIAMAVYGNYKAHQKIAQLKG